MFPKSSFSAIKNGGNNSASQPKAVDDQVLWENLKQGNDLAFSMLYQRYVQTLYNYGMNAFHDKELVQDCLQELFTRLWDKRETLGDDIKAINFYLFKSFRRLLIKHVTANRKYILQTKDSNELLFEYTPSMEDIFITNEYQHEKSVRLKACLLQLSKRQREVIFLKYYNELSHQEVANIMDLQVESVYNLLSKAIELLRKKLRQPSVTLTY